jgi:hypothetical protein
MINPDTGHPLTSADACFKKGASVTYSASAAKASRDAVKTFLMKTFAMSGRASR